MPDWIGFAIFGAVGLYRAIRWWRPRYVESFDKRVPMLNSIARLCFDLVETNPSLKGAAKTARYLELAMSKARQANEALSKRDVAYLKLLAEQFAIQEKRK